jgi:hypothetical protein
VTTAHLPGPLVPTDPKELQKVLDRAQQGDEKTLPVLRELLKDPYYLDACGDMARHAENALIRKCAGQSVAVREGIRSKMEALRAELAGASPSPLERVLAERIVACWLHVNHLETAYGNKDSLTLDLGNYYQRCLDRAHKRYLSAIKTLAVVRKLAVPVLQVNIARKQVNVAGPYVAPDKE